MHHDDSFANEDRLLQQWRSSLFYPKHERWNEYLDKANNSNGMVNFYVLIYHSMAKIYRKIKAKVAMKSFGYDDKSKYYFLYKLRKDRLTTRVEELCFILNSKDETIRVEWKISMWVFVSRWLKSTEKLKPASSDEKF